MDLARPRAGALAVSGGRVLALGSRAELDGLRGPGTEVLELGDRVAMPGRHRAAHAPVEHRAVRRLDGLLAVQQRRRLTPWWTGPVRRPRRRAPGRVGHRKLFDPSLFAGEPELTAAILDRVAPDKPCGRRQRVDAFPLRQFPRALAAARITPHTPDPPGGRYLPRERSAHRGGFGADAGDHDAAVRCSAAQPRRCVRRHGGGFSLSAASQGVTKVHEGCTGARFGAGELDILHGLWATDRPVCPRGSRPRRSAPRGPPGRRPGCGPATVMTWCAR